MGNTCSCFSNAIELPVEVVSHLDEAISFMETRLDATLIDKPEESTPGAETLTISTSVDSSIKYGSYFLETVVRRVKRRTYKVLRCYLDFSSFMPQNILCWQSVKRNSKIQKVVTDILKEAEPAHWVGAGVSVVAYVLDHFKMDKVSSNGDECVEVLRFMCGITKHIKRQINYLVPGKLNDVVVFIVKGSIFCMSRMQTTDLSSSFSALVEEEEIKSLQSQLVVNYGELGQYPDEDDKKNALEFPQDIMSSLNELMSYIETCLAKRTATEKTEEGASPVASSVKYGGDLLENVLKRCKRRGVKKVSGGSRKVVIDVLKETSQIHWVAAGLSVVAYILQKVDDASTNKEECFQFLQYMYFLAKHMKQLDGQITNDDKIHDVAEFIFEASFFCLSRIQSSYLSRYVSSSVDVQELKRLQTQLGQKYQDLTLEALIETLHRMPIVLPPSQGQYPDAVGIEGSVLEVTKLLGMDDEKDESIRAVVIYGLGGMGKTTLANAVFNSLYLKAYKHCRLNIKQDCSETDVKDLQAQILNDMFYKNLKLRDSQEGHEHVSKVFREEARQPLFMFIDNALKGDVLSKILPQDLSCFPKRSRMLLTTRMLNETDLLDQPNVISRCGFPINSLPDEDAKKLLSKKALDSPVGTFDESSDIDGLLRMCGGIPLVLDLVGTRLHKHRNNLSAFNSTIETFKDSLGKGDSELTARVVDVVYDSLPGGRHRDAFLEIAAFFSSREKQTVSYIVGKDELLALEEAALVKISDDRVGLHDVILKRGRKLSEPDRIIGTESLRDIIDNTQRLEKVKGIYLPQTWSSEFQLQAKDVDKMHKCLRVLIIKRYIKVTGACTTKFENLRYLQIANGDCSPVEIRQAITPNLVIFEGKVRSDHSLSELPGSLRRLKVDALESSGLDESFGKLSQLEWLELHQQRQYMTRLPQSFGQLNSLRYLNLFDFIKLTSLPKKFGQLSKLKELSIVRCQKLSSLSDDFGHMKSLLNLNISHCHSLKRLSNTFGQLSNLKDLSIWNCKSLERLSDNFGQLSNLKQLNITDCPKLSSLSDDFGQMKSLLYLKIHGCISLERLSNNFGQLSNLKELNIKDCLMLSSLSDDFGQMKSLLNLKIHGCIRLERLSDNFGQLSNLKELNIKDCPKLSSLSDDFGQMKSLLNLNILGCESLERLSDNFGQLSNFKELNIKDCPKLSSLSDDFGQMKSLLNLNIHGCESLQRLSDNFGQLSNLKELNIQDCPKLSSLSDDFGQMKSLLNLNIHGCESLERLSDSFGQLSNLKKLSIEDCPVLFSLSDDFGQMKSLLNLNIHKCGNLNRLSNNFGQLSNLKKLSIEDCPMLFSLSDDFGQMKSLLNLNIYKCKNLERLSDNFGQLSNLKELNIEDCTKLSSLSDDFGSLRCVTRVTANDCPLLDGKAVDQMIELKSLMVLEIRGSQQLINRWKKIKDGHPHCIYTGREMVSMFDSHAEAEEEEMLDLEEEEEAEEEEMLDLEEEEEVEIIFKKRKEGVQIPEEEEINTPTQGEAITTRHYRGLSDEDSKKLLCLKALGSAEKVFYKSLDIDGLLKLCRGIPPVLEMVGSMLRKIGNDVSAGENTFQFLRDTLANGEGDHLTERIVNVVYETLREDVYKDAFLDITTFFFNWRERTVGYIVEEVALRAIQEAALIQISEEGGVVAHDIVRERGEDLSKEVRITDPLSLRRALQDTQRLEKLKGIRLGMEWPSFSRFSFPYDGDDALDLDGDELKAEDLDKMYKCLRVLILGKGAKVTGACSKFFENLRYLKINNGDRSPMELNKLPRLAIFEGRTRIHDRLCNLPDSLRRLKVDALECDGLDESFGKLSRLEELDISQNESYMTILPQSFGQLKSLRCLKLSHFRELTSLPDTFSQLSNLEELNISDCTKLFSLCENFGKLSNLKRLKIMNCESLLNLCDDFGELNNLKKLGIVNCTNMASLSDSFDQLSNLKKLVIVNCSNLSSLCSRFGRLKSLKYLRIRGCRRLERLSDDFGSLACVAVIESSGCPVLEGKTVDQMIQLKSLTVLNIRESQLLIKRWEEIKEGSPLLVRTELSRNLFLRNSMSRTLFDGESRFVNVDGLMVSWPSNFTAGEEKFVFLVTCCDLCSPSNEAALQVVKGKMAALCPRGYQIIYVGLMEESEESIGRTLRFLSQGIERVVSLCAWIPPPSHYKWKELFGFFSCMTFPSALELHTFIVQARISAIEQGNLQVKLIRKIFPSDWDETFDSVFDEDWELENLVFYRDLGDLEFVWDVEDLDKRQMIDLRGGFSSLYSHLHPSFISSSI